MMSNFDHFRSSPRPSILCSVSLRRIDAKTIECCQACTRDIGIGGLFLETDKLFEIGELLEVSLSTPSKWEPLTLKALVIRIEKREDKIGGIGLRFVDLTQSQSLALNEFVASLDFEQ